MKPYKINLINALTLIILGFWGYIETNSGTALIPVGFGLILCLFSFGLKKENKIFSHLVVLLTLIILIALIGMPLQKQLETGGLGLIRVIAMILTSILAMISFIKSFIEARRKKEK